ncbi:MAG TPA: FAD-dependent oxidoreductase, partial [Acidobacteriota bacterium]|nr:FAD-dependent oxidoreductase [Acidobacteriota bacterium]
GGGNVAMDCARMVRRLGAGHVQVACIEGRGEMRADPEEVSRVEAEGIQLRNSTTISRILTRGGKAAGVELSDVASFAFDDDKNLELEVVEGSSQSIGADMVLFAIGQMTAAPPGFRCDMRAGRFIEIDPWSFQTSSEGVFAAGDAVSGKGTVIDAVASGRNAAMAVDRFLGGGGMIDEKLVAVEEPGAYIGPGDDFASMSRCGGHEMDEKAAGRESQRCLQCDLRLKIRTVKVWSNY